MNTNEAAIEQEIQARGLNAPRLTPEKIDAAIVGESFTTLPSGKVMVCELTLRNGFTVRGEAATVSKENFDEEIGRRVSRENARKKVWEAEGYLLQEMLHQAAVKASSARSDVPPHLQRVVAEKVELDERLEKLTKFFSTNAFEGLDRDERNRLTFQAAVMSDYSNVLAERLQAAGVSA